MEKPETYNAPSRAICITRAIVSLVCILLPILVGVLAVFVALECEMDAKYVEDASLQPLAIASLVAVFLPFICISFFRGQRDHSRSIVSRAISSLPTLPALYLAYYSLTKGIGNWDIAIFFLSIMAAIFFVLKLFDDKDALKLICAFCVFALGTLIIATLYSDFLIELNSIYKLAVQFGAVALILGTIADSRVVLSRIGGGWFIALKSVSASLCLICSGLIFTVFLRGFTVLPYSYFVLSLLFVCYAISALTEIISLCIGYLKGSFRSVDAIYR